MVNTYASKNDYYQAKAQRKKTLTIFFIMIGVYILASAIILTIYLLQPYNSPKLQTLEIIEYVLTAVAVFVFLMFFHIPYKRVNKYFLFCKILVVGLKERSEVNFLEFDDKLREKEGVDCKSLVCLEWNKYKDEYFERRILVFYEKEFPPIPAGARLSVVTTSNFLVEYEIIELPNENEIDSE